MRGNNEKHWERRFMLLSDREDDFLQIRIAGGIANHDFKFAGFDAELHVDIIEGKEIGSNLERDGFGLAGLECHALEAFQFFNGSRDRTVAVANVHLDDFITEASAGVCDVYMDASRIFGTDVFSIEPKVRK